MKALILVDFENEWINKESEYYVGNITDVIKRTNQLIDHCRKKGYKIIWTRHIEPDSKTAFAKNTNNVNIIPQLHTQESDVIITKYKISPFYKTTLENELQGIKEIVICGILTNLCVRSLAEEAYDRDFIITILKDCCVTFDKKTHEFTLKDLKSTREEINIKTVKEFIR